MLNWVIMGVAILAGAALMRPRLARAELWRAMTTPLASIIGSGFLILAPVLNGLYGAWAPLVMALLCAVAWAFGAAVRHNIAADIAALPVARAERRIDIGSEWALAFAYFIAVAYYLNLFGAFAVDLTPWNGPLAARIVASAVFLVILVVGWTRGFRALERMEQISVAIKLAIIAGLLAGLVAYFAAQASGGRLEVNPVAVGPWEGLALGFGLIVTVQGFETSRYLGATYDAGVRIRSMRLAQGVSTAIYLVYIGLATYVFHQRDVPMHEAAIISMMRVVAPVLPLLLVGGALAAQFSAAAADTSGAGGLIEELSRRRVRARQAYGLLVAAGLVLTWSFDVFEIISYASRAFAFYYALQAAVAAVSAWRAGSRGRAAWFGALAVFGLVITVFGAPVEGDAGP